MAFCNVVRWLVGSEPTLIQRYALYSYEGTMMAKTGLFPTVFIVHTSISHTLYNVYNIIIHSHWPYATIA